MKVITKSTSYLVFNACLVVVTMILTEQSFAQTLPPTNNLAAWYKPETLSSLTNDQTVTSWTDSSGNGHTITRNTTSPSYVTNGINGRPSVFFTQSENDQLITSSAVSLLSGMTYVAVFKTFSTDSTSSSAADPALTLVSDDTITGSTALGLTGGNGQFIRFDNQVSASYLTITGSSALNNTNVYPGHYLIATHAQNAGNTNDFANLYADGSLQATANIPYNSVTSFDSVGRGVAGLNTFDGWISEVLVYSTDLSTADRLQLQTYLNERWLDVPEPSTIGLALLGGLAWRLRRRRCG